MKRAFTIILLILPLQLFAQHVSIDLLIKLHGKDVNDANDYLLERGWAFLGTEDIKDNVLQKRISWSWDPSKNNKTQAFKYINYIFNTFEDRPTTVFVQTHSRNEYLQMRKEIDSYGMKKINSEARDNAVIADFAGKNYVVRTIVAERKNEPTTYLFTLYNRNYYRVAIAK